MCRTPVEASRVASDLSRAGMPAASVGQRDFGARWIRAQVVTDETLDACRPGADGVLQLDPAGSPRRHRRRVEAGAATALIVTLVVPEHVGEATRLCERLGHGARLRPADLAEARSLVQATRAERVSAPVTLAAVADEAETVAPAQADAAGLEGAAGRLPALVGRARALSSGAMAVTRHGVDRVSGWWRSRRRPG